MSTTLKLCCTLMAILVIGLAIAASKMAESENAIQARRYNAEVTLGHLLTMEKSVRADHPSYWGAATIASRQPTEGCFPVGVISAPSDPYTYFILYRYGHG